VAADIGRVVNAISACDRLWCIESAVGSVITICPEEQAQNRRLSGRTTRALEAKNAGRLASPCSGV
jgi:hypothetical protein